MTETRKSPRHRVLKAGTIDLGGGAIDCTIRSLSATGAMLEVAGQSGVPERFTLVISADELHIPCYVVWRGGRRIGVAFEPDCVPHSAAGGKCSV